MDRTMAIICLVVLLVFLVGILRVLLPTVKKFVHRMPKSIFILLFVMIAAAMIWLIVFIVNDVTGGGQTGGDEQDRNTVSQEETPPVENCIIVRGSDIIIENMQADWDYVGKYIDYRVENNIELTVVDDYSVSSAYRGIIDLCREKGVRYITENETWLEQQ